MREHGIHSLLSPGPGADAGSLRQLSISVWGQFMGSFQYVLPLSLPLCLLQTQEPEGLREQKLSLLLPSPLKRV